MAVFIDIVNFIFLWFLCSVIYGWRWIAPKGEERLGDIPARRRWMLVLPCAMLAGFGYFSLLFLWGSVRFAYGPDSVVPLVYIAQLIMGPPFLAIAIGTMLAPENKKRTCNILTAWVLLAELVVIAIFYSSSIAAGISIFLVTAVLTGFLAIWVMKANPETAGLSDKSERTSNTKH